ncbi:MAG: manganese efflux pump [Candidatus Zixiibacteriota bacterium]|nr:MAG: manganese efflux pump [candidate division Zixibacteria bacterium]
MPIIGWMFGEYLSGVVGAYAQWLAAVVLAVIGVRLIWEQLAPNARHWQGDPTRGMSLIVLMFATSVDALAAGFTLGLVGLQILYPTLIIGVVAASMTVVGLVFGRALGLRFSRSAGVVGGLILIGLAVKTVLG